MPPDPDLRLPHLQANPWQALRRFTPARIALGRAGISQPTTAQLEFQLAHARARDAVHAALDVAPLRATLAAQGFESLSLRSAAADRNIYLQRPDLGRRLDPASRQQIMALGTQHHDIAIVLADGLSALALERHAVPLLASLKRLFTEPQWRCAPLAVVEQGRVAIGDEIGELLHADLVVVLIGERPGLSSPDSLGLYLSWAPRIGLNDAQRNCISNVRPPAGLAYDEAARRLHYLACEARRRRLSGVDLKDETPAAPQVLNARSAGFLIDDSAPA